MSTRPVPERSAGPRAARRARGFVLLTMLVLLVALTVLVTAQVQRATTGQSLTNNTSDYVLAETAAQSVLRYCEAAVMASAGQPTSVRVTTPGTRGVDSAAWRTAAKWTASEVGFDAAAIAFPGVQSYGCLFEDATADLVPSAYANDVNPESQPALATCSVLPGMNPRLCKYRINARVVLDRGRVINLQSEIRFAI
jgi:hypothetical protein